MKITKKHAKIVANYLSDLGWSINNFVVSCKNPDCGWCGVEEDILYKGDYNFCKKCGEKLHVKTGDGINDIFKALKHTF